jgi:hypothetical protein
MLKEGHHNLIGKVVLLFYDSPKARERTEPPPTPMAIPDEIRNVIGKTTVTTAIEWTDPLSNKYSINKDV